MPVSIAAPQTTHSPRSGGLRLPHRWQLIERRDVDGSIRVASADYPPNREGAQPTGGTPDGAISSPQRSFVSSDPDPPSRYRPSPRILARCACYSRPAMGSARLRAIDGSTTRRSSHMRSMRMAVRLASVLAAASLAAQSGGAGSVTIPRTLDGKPDFQGYWNLPYVPNMAAGGE